MLGGIPTDVGVFGTSGGIPKMELPKQKVFQRVEYIESALSV